MKYIKIITLSLGLVIFSGLAFFGVANAQSFKAGDSITVPVGTTVDSMLFAGGNNLDIAGTVNGDVYCGGQNINISGTVKGDVFCGGQTITISGTIEGSVRLGGQNVTISGTIGSSATIGATDLILDSKGSIGRDLLGGSQNVTINGIISRDMLAGAQNLTVNGKIGRNFKGGMTTLTVGSSGIIGGNVDFTSLKDPIVNSGGQIVGSIKRTTPKEQPRAQIYAPMVFAFGWFVYVLFATLIMALVLVGLFPRILNESSLNAMKKPGQTILVGLVGALVIPILVVTLFATIVGIPLSILLLLAWFISMILSGFFSGYVVGRALMHKSYQPVWSMLVGVGILTLTYFVPVVGFITMLAAYLFGLGMVMVQSKQLLGKFGKKKI